MLQGKHRMDQETVLSCGLEKIKQIIINSHRENFLKKSP